jgi:predicted nucleotidyltransferase component of viral defense system
MLDDQLPRLITITSEILALEDPVIEKDYYVTQVIHALSNVENEYFRLVFCGGTCLAKAHKVVARMSEDVDFKIEMKAKDANFSKTRFLKELKEFRTYIKAYMTLPSLIIGESVVRNEGKYSRIEIDYPSVLPGNTQLRPHILLEFTVSDIHLAVTSLPVKTLIEETLKNIILFPPSLTYCVSVNETAIEKWVGLTRRIIAIERDYHPDDSTLVRHIYDLNSIKQANKIGADFFILASVIINNDAKQFKKQHSEYSTNPRDEIRQSLNILKNKPIWKERYNEFINTMVYDNTNTPEFESAIITLEHISAKVIDRISEPL